MGAPVISTGVDSGVDPNGTAGPLVAGTVEVSGGVVDGVGVLTDVAGACAPVVSDEFGDGTAFGVDGGFCTFRNA